MYNGKTISLGSILWKVMKHPLASELTYEEGAELALEYIRLVGAPVVFETIISDPIKIVEYKAGLPLDLLNLKGIKYIEDCEHDNSLNKGIAMRSASDIYHSGLTPNSSNPNNIEYTYKIQKGIVFTSTHEGYLVVSYDAIATDDEGYPLVPDQEEFKLGLEYYILHRYIEPLWIIGKVTDKAFSYIESKRHFYLASASNKLQMPDVDQMETMMNGLNRIISNNGGHETFFRLYGNKESIKRYN